MTENAVRISSLTPVSYQLLQIFPQLENEPSFSSKLSRRRDVKMLLSRELASVGMLNGV